MVTNPIYQATIEELERYLSPRVVSHAVKEGLNVAGRTPETASLEDLEQILKVQVFRQLHAAMPITSAKETIAELIGKLRGEADQHAAAAGAKERLLAQADEIDKLNNELLPLNQYFEWPEVQKLRAQVHLLEVESRSRREAPDLLASADLQLRIVKQKLEDELTLQARDLAALDEALEEAEKIGGPVARRLASLAARVRAAHDDRELAPEELARAQRLVRELEAALVGNELEGPGDESMNLAAQVHELNRLYSDYTQLFSYVPELGARAKELLGEAELGRPVSSELAELAADLKDANQGLISDLTHEIEGFVEELPPTMTELDTTELDQAASVALSVLTTTLPNRTDVEHIRRLVQLAREQLTVIRQAKLAEERQLAEQGKLIARIDEALRSAEAGDGPSPYPQALLDDVEKLRSAQGEGSVAPELAEAIRRTEERLSRERAERATDQPERRRARLDELRAQLDSLPAWAAEDPRAAQARRDLQRLRDGLDEAGSATLLLLDGMSPTNAGDADADIDAVASLVSAVREDQALHVELALAGLREEAAELGSASLDRRLQAAMAQLLSGEMPDLEHLKAAVRQEQEAVRTEQVNALHKLAVASSQFAGDVSPTVIQLREALDAAQADIGEGKKVIDLTAAEGLLAQAQAELADRLSSIPARLDAALASLGRVEVLNSDDVTTARRVLYHLNSERHTLERLSPGLRSQLESSLTTTELILDKLLGELEATSRIADVVVSGGLFDDALGLTPPGGAEPGAAARAPGDLTALRGVSSARRFSQADLRGPAASAASSEDAELLDLLRLAARVSGADGASPAVLTLSTGSGGLAVRWDSDGSALVVRTESAADLRNVMAELTRGAASDGA